MFKITTDEGVVITLTKQCVECKYASQRDPSCRCYYCEGGREVPNKNGEILIKFLREYGKFANEEHGHYID